MKLTPMVARRLLKHFLVQPLRTWRWPMYENRFLDLVSNRKLERISSPRQILRGVSDQYLLWLFAYSMNFGYQLGDLIPTMPPDDMQRNWTGKMGEATLREALHFFQIIRAMASKYSGGVAEDTKILDYGCGWGRIVRFFLRDVNYQNLWGCDCYQKAIEAARSENRWCNFELIGPFPPTPFLANTFDIIYLFSVFSHLSEDLQLKLLPEFWRILRPGGILIATTRTRDFIILCERLRQRANIPVNEDGCKRSFIGTEAFLSRYDEGLFCHSPSGGGGILEPSFYGESCIPRKYVENVWTEWFEILEYRRADRRCNQNTICCRKRQFEPSIAS